MKKLAIVLVVLTCLLAGALLPALAEANPVYPAATEGPKKPTSESAPDAEPVAPKATEKPDGFEAPEPPHRHGRPGTAHRHHGEKGPQARPDERTPRGPRENERPRHAAPHCRRCEPERSRPHCAGCPFADERPGWQDSRPVEPRQDPLPEPEPRRAEEAGTKMALPLGPGAII